MIPRAKVTLVKLFFYLLILLPGGVAAQVSISGSVINRADKKPIPDASVFLSNTTIGGKTAADGTFILHNVKPGKYELVVSVVGFQTYNKLITAERGNVDLPTTLLSPKTISLNEVTVKFVVDPKRNKYYKWFKDEFLGTSWRADECKITNPALLDLYYNDTTKILTATSADFLQVENDALGYKIKYLLTGFSKNTFAPATKKVQYKGSAVFEEMTGTPAQQKRWQKRRLEVYEGSLTHFLRCVLNNTYEDAGFRVYRLLNSPDPRRPADSVVSAKVKLFEQLARRSGKYDDSLNYWRAKAMAPAFTQLLDPTPLKQSEIVKLTDEKGLYALSGKEGSLLVVYYKDHMIDGSEKLGEPYDPLKKLKTVINFNTTNVFLDRNGTISDPAVLSLDGAWSNYRMAELLPVDYIPNQSPSPEAGKPADNNIEAAETGADAGNFKNSLLALKARNDSLALKITPERLYLQLDKPYYAIGDTIWFKAYLFNNFLTPSRKSGILNINIANDSNKVIRRYRLPLASGLTWGNIVLEDKYFTSGTYTLRAYTDWMRNFGDNGFFYKTFTVSSAGNGQLLVNTSLALSNINGVPSVDTKLRFSTITGMPFAAQPVTLQVTNDNKRLYAQKYVTGVDGGLDVNFTPPQKPVNLDIVVQNGKKERLATISVQLNRPQNADVQFLPEGGSMVAGLPAHIGFKAVGEDGRGLDISGTITDHTQKQVATFKSLHKGMGSFGLDVKDGESYTAKVTLPGGVVKQYALPPIKSAGTTLLIKNDQQNDSLMVTIAPAGNNASAAQSYFLIGRARNVVCYAAIVAFHQNNPVVRKIAKNKFPTGITHFTLMTSSYQPVNERLVFIDRHDDLQIRFVTDKTAYGKRDSVGLRLQVKDSDGQPVSGNFSMAVTDDAQVRLDTLDTENIVTRLLLTADLTGYIEQPGYYLSDKSPEAWKALDNLLLTQGWVGYDWAQVFDPPALAFQPEQGLGITGHVVNVLNKPVKGTSVLLFSKSPAILMDTVTDKNGQFVFDRLPKIDTPIFILKAVNKRGKSFNVGVTVDEIPPPAFTKPAAPLANRWFVNVDSTLVNYTKNAAVKQLQDYTPGGHMLREVSIKAKKIIKDSQNLNGSGNADFVLDEKDLEAAGKKTWLQLLRENIPGFKDGIFINGHSQKAIKDMFSYLYVTDFNPDPVSRQWYFIYDRPIKLIVDGVSIDQLLQIKTFRELSDYLSNTAEDIKGFEVITSTKFALSYLSRFDPIDPNNGVPLTIEAVSFNPPIAVGPSDIAFVEITTRSGKGPAIGNTPGMYLYKPLPLSWPKQFYKPKYALKDTTKNHLDLRSTIDWQPNLVTDANGEATVWFYTADKSSTYAITVEGTDMKGHLGYRQGKIKVEAGKNN